MTQTADGEPLVVVVTGASSGIGRATAILLSHQGAHVVLAARSEAALLEAQQECAEGSTLVVPTDVARPRDVDSLIDATVERYGQVDAVVHSAAVLAYGRFEDVPPEVFDASIAVTLLGTATVARAALRQFSRQGGGSLVVVGSLLGKIAVPYMSSYVTAKWGVHGLVRCLQIETRLNPDVHVSLVWPGGVDTPVYTQAGTYVGRHGRPPPPVVSPERVARAIIRRIERPARETSVGPGNPVSVLGFRLLPGVFDLLVSPLMRFAGLSADHADPTSGNVLEPQPSGEATHGQWGGSLPRQLQAAGMAAVGFLGQHSSAPVGEQPREDSVMNSELSDQGRARVSRRTNAPASTVWAVLADGWLYANWVVGASRVREVDLSWPGVGSRIHHSFGVWPAVINDETVVLESVPNRRLVLEAKGWPLGEARVELRIEQAGDNACDLSVVEDAVKGPGVLVPRAARQPLIAIRNREALRRLSLIAEGRQREMLSGP